MANRKITVHRIFSLGQFKNIQYESTTEDVPQEEVVAVMREMTKEIHDAFAEYKPYLKSLKGEE